MTTQKPLPQPLTNELLDSLLSNYKKPEDLIGENGLLKQLTKVLVERALQAELTTHLGPSKYGVINNESGNARNGKSHKILKGEFGELPIEVPRDHQAALSPRSLPNIKPVGQALTTRSFRYTPRHERSRNPTSPH